MRLGKFISVFVLTAIVCVFPAQAQRLSNQEARKAKLEKEMRILQDQIDANAKKSGTAAVRLKLLKEKTAARRELLKNTESELRVIHDSLYINQKRINVLQERLDTMTYYYAKLVRNAYKNRDARTWYMYVLSSGNIGQATRRFAYLRDLSVRMNNQATRIISARDELLSRKKEMEKLRDRAMAVRSSHQSELDKLKKEEKESLSLVTQLGKDKKKYQAQLESKRKEVQALNREIDRLISGTVGGKKKNVDYTLSKSFADNQGKLPWPAEGRVIEHFGQHNHPVYKNVKLPFNNGINISLPKDTPVKAVFGGEVRSVIVMPGYNQCVLIQHGEYFTFYCKLASVSVKAGQKVNTGSVIGKVTTIAGETQLHFQLWKGRTPQNPELWLR